MLYLVIMLGMTSLGPLSGFDPRFDFDAESPYRDADTYSDTLRLYHQLLWSKMTPVGEALSLNVPRAKQSAYLTHSRDDEIAYWFASDAITNSYTTWIRPKTLVEAKMALTDAQVERYLNPNYTIGSASIWPLRKMHGSINTARVWGRVADRMDLTLECIRRLYLGDNETPLGSRLSGYADFFELFESFAGFVEFFHLQQLVNTSLDQVEFWLPFDGFVRHGAPASVDEYVRLREATLEFIADRGARMASWVRSHTGVPVVDR